MAVIVNGDGILTGISSLATALTDITSGRGTITGVTTVGTLQLGAGVSISSPRSQNAAIFTNNSEFFTVDDAGRVGVGTVTPNSDAHPQNVGKINVGFITARSIAGDIDANTMVVAGVSTFVGALNASSVVSSGAVSGTTATFTGGILLDDSISHIGDTDTKIRFSAANTVSMEVNGSEGFKVDTTGTTLTSTTDASLFINTTNSNGSHIRFQTSGTNKTFLGQASGIAGSLGGANDFAIRSAEDIVLSTNNDNTPNLTLDTSGRTLLGTTTQNNNAKLQVTTDQQVVASFEGTGVSDPQIYLGDNMASPTDNCIILGYDKADNRGYLTVGGDGDNVFTVTNGGAIGINNTAPVEKLGISGNMRFVNATGATSRINALPSGSYSTGTSGGSAICFQRIAEGGGGGSDEIFFETHWQGNRHGESCRINKYGNLAFPSGQGIDFSATGGPTNGTGSSELFDDYEEGTFSPGVNGGTTNTQTFDSQGRYTKIGRMVYCQFLLQYSGAGTGAHVSYSGLPFTSLNNSSRGGGTVLWTNIPGLNDFDAISVTVNGNDTAIYLYYNMDNNAITGSGGFANKAMYVRVTYEAA